MVALAKVLGWLHMSQRKVEEWTGATPDTRAPDRVRLRVFERADGRCHRCDRKIRAGDKWTLEHLVAIINGGPNAEGNLGVTCSWCLPGKNAEDVAEKSLVARKRKKDLGITKAKRPIPGGRDSRWKRTVDGRTVER